jgi:hypothetical protein
VKSLRKKTPNNGTIVVLIATEAEVAVLIEALDIALLDPTDPSHRDTNEYGNLRVDLLQARYGK